MPSALIKSTAKKAHRAVKRIEAYWDEAKEAASKKGLKKGDDSYWAYVNAIVQRRSGLRECLTFRQFLEEGSDDAEHGLELSKTGFYGKAGAGAIIVARDTGNLLMPLRSQRVEQPNTWGTWGGAIDSSEDPARAAKREIQEEAGYEGRIEMIPLFVFKHPSGFRYHNFIGLVDEEFEPTLDWETQKAKWVPFNRLPRPLHFGLQAVLEDSGAVEKLKKFTNRT